MAKIVKEVKQVFGFLGEDQDYSKKQLTLTSWGVYSPKFDIRTWSEDYEKAGKGMTFTAQELIALKELLNQLPLEELLNQLPLEDYLEEDE